MPDRDELFTVDTPQVNAAGAARLMVYHLMMAAAYWEVVPGDRVQSWLETEMGPDSPQPLALCYAAACAWAAEMKATYDDFNGPGAPGNDQ
jgi:hypothetical protein